MALNYNKNQIGITFVPQNTIPPSIDGDVRYNSATNKLELFDGVVDPIVTEGGAPGQIHNLTNANLSGSAGITNANLATMPNDTFKGNISGITATPSDLTINQVVTTLGALTSIGTIDTNGAGSDGLTRTGSILFAQSASATEPGMVNTTTQVFAGAKTFNTSVKSPAFISSTANPATVGAVELANGDNLAWRNAGNTANENLTVDSSNNLNYSGPGIATNGLILEGSTSGTFTQQANAVTTPYTVKWPAIQGTVGTVPTNDGSGNLTWGATSGFTPTAPTVQKFTSGSGTYTRPSSPTPLYIKVLMIGGGGGGAADSSTSNAGSAGSDTTFGTSLLLAGKGGGGGASGSFGQDAGIATTSSLGIGPIGIAFPGASGMSASGIASGQAGLGGCIFGGNGIGWPNGTAQSAPTNAAVNSGSGGGGGTPNSGAGRTGGGGGASGGYVDATIISPASTYAYSVGTGGTGGSSPNSSGSNGGSGLIIVYEFYQ